MIADERLAKATDWFMRVRSEDAREEDLLALAQWLRAHSDNAGAYRQVFATWSAVGRLASSPEILIGRRDALEHARRTQRGRWSYRRRIRPWQSLAAGVAGIGAVVLLTLWAIATREAVYETGTAERRVLTLADGSLVNLDACTRIRVSYTEEARTLSLENGQASFKVASDPARPFRVKVRGQSVVALGTEFNIDLTADKVVVTLIEGRVAIVPHSTPDAPGHAAGGAVEDGAVRRAIAFATVGPASGSRHARKTLPRPEIIELSAGQQLVSTTDGPPELRSNVDPDRALAWRNGRLIFNDEPLADAVARLNRYTVQQIEADPAVARIRISGSFNAGDLNAVTDALSAYFPVNVERTRAGAIRLTARPEPRENSLRASGHGR